jgi:hypothetical protein
MLRGRQFSAHCREPRGHADERSYEWDRLSAWIARVVRNSTTGHLKATSRGIRDRLVAGDEIRLDDRQGFTALHFAAQQSQTEAVRVLLEAGAPLHPRDRFGNTPLWRAVFNSGGKEATVEARSSRLALIRTSSTKPEQPHVTWPREWALKRSLPCSPKRTDIPR